MRNKKNYGQLARINKPFVVKYFKFLPGSRSFLTMAAAEAFAEFCIRRRFECFIINRMQGHG